MKTCVNQSCRRKRIEMQGFVGLDDETLRGLGPWFRLAPAICMVWTSIGTIGSSWRVIWGLVPFAFLGAVLPKHPFDLIYEWGFRRWLGSPSIPRYGTPRRFACFVATVWLGFTGWAFYSGANFLGWVLGTVMSLMALVQVSSDFCIPSFFFSLFRGAPGKAKCLIRSAVAE